MMFLAARSRSASSQMMHTSLPPSSICTPDKWTPNQQPAKCLTPYNHMPKLHIAAQAYLEVHLLTTSIRNRNHPPAEHLNKPQTKILLAAKAHCAQWGRLTWMGTMPAVLQMEMPAHHIQPA